MAYLEIIGAIGVMHYKSAVFCQTVIQDFTDLCVKETTKNLSPT
jgi:hypothetical protein